jgi:hypothetical protein
VSSPYPFECPYAPSSLNLSNISALSFEGFEVITLHISAFGKSSRILSHSTVPQDCCMLTGLTAYVSKMRSSSSRSPIRWRQEAAPNSISLLHIRAQASTERDVISHRDRRATTIQMTNFFIFRHSSLLSPSIAASQLCLCNHEKGQQWTIEQQQPKIFQVGRYPARVYAHRGVWSL